MIADVVVIGAGIMGVSTAYHLARRRAGRIVVLERDGVCSGSTALASGGIRHQSANRVGIELPRIGELPFALPKGPILFRKLSVDLRG